MRSGLFQQLALLGINAFMIAQDRGSDNGVGDGATHVCYPGSDPWVTSVGGTVVGNIKNGSAAHVRGMGVEQRRLVRPMSAASPGRRRRRERDVPVPSYQTAAGITQITDSASNNASSNALHSRHRRDGLVR